VRQGQILQLKRSKKNSDLSPSGCSSRRQPIVVFGAESEKQDRQLILAKTHGAGIRFSSELADFDAGELFQAGFWVAGPN
jgi:hypothetical protein